MATTAAATVGVHETLRRERNVKYWLIAPAVFVMLLVGLFPILYSLVVSVQNVTLMDQDYSWYGFGWYEFLLEDERFWESLWHTGLITIIALPAELIIGLLLAQLFLGDLRGQVHRTRRAGAGWFRDCRVPRRRCELFRRQPLDR